MKNLNVTKMMLMFTGVIMFIAFEVNAQPGRGYGAGKGRGLGSGIGPFECSRLDVLLNLTDEQKGKIENLRTGFQKNILPSRNEIREKQARLQTLMTSEQVNQTEVNTLVDEMGALRTSIHKARVNHHQEIRKLLTEDQRVKFDAGFRGGFGERNSGFWQHRRHGRGWN